MFYNRPNSMLDAYGHRSAPVPMRPHVVMTVAACVLCAWAGAPSLLSAQDADPETFLRDARRLLAHGRAADAETLARTRGASDPLAAVVLARLALSEGRHGDARALLEPAAEQDPAGEAALELGLLHQRFGRTEEAETLFTGIVRGVTRQSGPDDLLRAARAARAVGRARDANALFRAAAAAAPGEPAVDTAWGLLFLEKHDRAEAVRSFRQALQADADWAPAHAGLALALAEENPPAAAAAAERALALDDRLADAHLLLARLDLDNWRYDAARERVARVLALDEHHLEARALLGAIAYVRDDPAGFDAEVNRVLTVHAGYGEVYRIAADLAARHYRFEEAVALSRRAVALDPVNARAHADLGLHLMRTGDEIDARRVLDRAFRADPYDVVTYNLLALLDTLEKFEVIREGNIVLKLHPDEAAVLREYAMPLAQEALRTLSARYEFEPEGPILIEIFPEHDDFAVRTAGLPGLIGALGVCFGKVIAMDSPRAARAPGSFAWQATLWHEMAHVITLQMSRQRVPRWLTEGISVYEESQARPEWGRDMELSFVRAMDRGEILELRDLNAGFTNPDTIALAYYQSSLLVDHIVRTRGTGALRALLEAHGDGLEGDEALVRALGARMDELQTSFATALDERFGRLRLALRELPPGVDAAAGGDALRRQAEANPGNYHAELALGRALAANDDPGAFAPLERAAALVPMATGEESPRAILAALAERLGDPARAVAALSALLEHDHTSLPIARSLAALADATGDRHAARLAYSRIVEIDPFDPEGHTGLGRLALAAGDLPTALREFRAALSLGPADRAGAHCDLGETYLKSGERDLAKAEALAALEIAPTFERAQELLLDAIGEAGEAQP